MSIIDRFPNIDISHWDIKNKLWLDARKREWPRIEEMLSHSKSGRGLNAIKRYYTSGKLPDWEKFSQWKNSERHVDLFILLWLHPSWDERLLNSLREEYIRSELITLEDFEVGVKNFLSASSIYACVNFPDNYIIPHPHTDGHNELLFDLIMGDLSVTEYTIARPEIYGPQSIFRMPKPSLFSLHEMGRWLCVKKMRPINLDMLYQYDRPLEWWYHNCTQDEEYYVIRKSRRAEIPLIQKALWRIYNFDTCAEGDSPRSQFVVKMRKILDEKKFIREIETIWNSIKNGQVTVDSPWEP